MNLESRLSPPGRGLSCNADGASLGFVPLLQRSPHGEWEPRDRNQLPEDLDSAFGLPIDLAPKIGGLNAIAGALRDFANYRARPYIGSDGRPVQVPILYGGGPLSDESGALIGRELFPPNAPLTRPGTDADWIDPLVDLASTGAMAVGPAVRVLGAGADAAAASSILEADTDYVISPLELRRTFDLTWPIG